MNVLSAMKTCMFPSAAAALAAAFGLLGATPARAAHDYPTLERVRFVQECMAEHKGGTFEMTSKCVCVVDALAQELSLEDFISLSTAQKATTIGGERGGYIRDSEALQDNIKRWRALQRKVKTACFINVDAR